MNKQEPMIFGIDLSVNHWAICRVDYSTGKCIDYRYMTDKKSEYVKNTANAFLLEVQDKKGGESKENYDERRRSFSVDNLFRYVCSHNLVGENPDIYIALEGYAYAASSRGMSQIAEMTGVLKTMLYRSGIRVRIFDPLSVKLYATGKGNCLKKEMIESSNSNGFIIPSSLIKKTVKKSKKHGEIEEYAGIGTDLADAFFLAKILRTELMLRAGIENLKDLGENERRIFLRTTKAFPENILSRPFIHKEEKE